jgi:phage repressor protein C with HTH and peptisase S24 domain
VEKKADPQLTIRITGCVTKLGGQRKAAAIIGVSQPGLRSWIMGETRAPFEGIAKLADAAGVSLDWMATGQGSPYDIPDGLVIAHFDADSQGAPMLQPADAVTLAAHPMFFREFGLDPGHLAIVRASDDAMAPEIPIGARAIVDMRPVKTLVEHGGLFAFGRVNGVIVRRVAVETNNIRLAVTNDDYKDKILTATELAEQISIRVWGKVVLILKRA